MCRKKSAHACNELGCRLVRFGRTFMYHSSLDLGVACIACKGAKLLVDK